MQNNHFRASSFRCTAEALSATYPDECCRDNYIGSLTMRHQAGLMLGKRWSEAYTEVWRLHLGDAVSSYQVK